MDTPDAHELAEEREQNGLAALRRSKVVDTPPEEAFDRIVRIARRVFGAPTALVSLVGKERPWFKVCHGLDVYEMSLDVFCARTIHADEVMVVLDATRDPRFADDPLVTGEPGVRFYAGAPLKTSDGRLLGALCVIDTEPRGRPSAEQLATLSDLAALVVGELELKRPETQSPAGRGFYERILSSLPLEVAVFDTKHRELFRNPEASKDAVAYGALQGHDSPAAEGQRARFQEAVRGRRPVSWEETCVDPQGTLQHYWRNLLPLVSDDGALEGVLGYGRNTTERKRVQDELERASRRMSAILETISDIFFSLDTEWRFTYLNAPAERFLGRPRGSLLQRNVWEAFPEMVGYAFYSKCQEAVSKGLAVIFEEYYPPTSTWFEVHLYPAREGLSVYLRDVSSRRQLEQARQEAQAELEQRVQERTAELAKANEQLLYNAFHDKLTGLANRALFLDRLGVAVERCKRRPENGFAVLFLDFDRFKLVNDSLGHGVGDALLVGLGRRLRACVRPGDTVARLGGDEFTVLLGDLSSVEEATRTAERIQQVLTAPLVLGGHTVHTTASIGIATSEIGYEHAEDVLRDADTAMYRAKALGKATYQVFTREMRERAVSLLTLENSLRGAVRRGELRVHYQPIVAVETGLPIGFEALVRWPHPEYGPVSPAEFIPIAEETGLIIELDRYVLREACEQVGRWQQDDPTSPLTLSVNLSGQQFTRTDLVETVAGILSETGFNPRDLKLELTESVLMGHTATVTDTLARLKALGVELHIDDFGTGYASLSYLQHFPLDTLKIDRSFIARLTESPEGSELVRTIIALAQNLGLQVTAEGVETEAQLGRLRALGCTFGQGYLFAKPLEAHEVPNYVARTAQAATVG